MNIANKMVVVPSENLPVLFDVDVVVAGGGSAGFAAAVAASRSGSKVLIIEKNNAFGGLWTNGLVLRLYGTHAHTPSGEVKNYYGGIGGEIVEKLSEMSAALHPFGEDNFEPTPDPQSAVHVMDNIIEKENVTVLFNTLITKVVMDKNKISALVCENKQGSFCVSANAFVDATGDADLLVKAGDSYTLVEKYSTGLNHLVAGVHDVKKEDFQSVYGKLPYTPNSDYFWLNMTGRRCDFTDMVAMSRLEIEHRNNMWEQLEKLREVSGKSDVYIPTVATQMGVRVTRIPQNDKTLSYADTINTPQPTDPIGVSGWANYEPEFKNKHTAYKIPYRVLLTDKTENLLMSGRCVNADDRAINSLRLVPNCFITGQAAGIAASIVAKSGIPSTEAYSHGMKDELEKQRVLLDY